MRLRSGAWVDLGITNLQICADWETLKATTRIHSIDGRLKSLPGRTTREQLAPFEKGYWPIWHDGYKGGWRNRADFVASLWARPFTAADPGGDDWLPAYLRGWNINWNVYLQFNPDGVYVNKRVIEHFARTNPDMILWCSVKRRNENRDWLEQCGLDYCLTGTLRRPGDPSAFA